MKAIFLLCVALLPVIIYGKTCQHLEVKPERIDYKELQGEWVRAATIPDYSQNCANFTVSNSELREEYYSKMIYWKHRSEKVYNIEKDSQNPQVLVLKNKHWYSMQKMKLTLLYEDVHCLLFYSCERKLWGNSENVEIWTRTHYSLEAARLPKGISNVIDNLGYNASDFHYRTKEDCLA